MCKGKQQMKSWKLASAAAALILSTSANAALIERLGGLAYYDDVANLTWLADANYAQTSGYDADGLMSWSEANNWASSLNVGGVDGWRLSTALNPDANCSDAFSEYTYGYSCTGSEMGNLHYNVLGNAEGSFSNSGPFSNINLTIGDDIYWSATELDADFAYGFVFTEGWLDVDEKAYELRAWAVHSGDVSAVPVPAAVWLFGSGLVGLAGIARRKKS